MRDVARRGVWQVRSEFELNAFVLDSVNESNTLLLHDEVARRRSIFRPDIHRNPAGVPGLRLVRAFLVKCFRTKHSDVVMS